MDGEVDLRPYLRSAWGYRRVIAGVALVVALVAGAVAHFLLPPIYEASAILMVTGPRFQVSEREPAQPMLGVTHVIQIAYTQTVAARVATRLGRGSETPQSLMDRVAFRPIKETNLFRIVAVGRTREQATNEAAAWASEVTVLTDDLQRQNTERSLAIVRQQIAEARGELGSAEEALREYQATSRLPILTERVRVAVRRIAAYEARLAEIERAGRAIEGDVSLSPSGDVYRLTVIAPGSAAQIRRVLDGLRQDLARNQAALAVEQEQSTRLDRRVTVARSTHQLLVQKGEELRILLGANAGPVHVALPPEAKDRPIAPRPLRSALVFGFLALFATALGAVVWDARGLSATVGAPAGRPLREESAEIVVK